MLKVNNRKLEGVPKEARLSLEFLDEVLDQYESEVEQFAENKPRHLEDIPVDVRHSLEILDDILTEYEGDDNSYDDVKDEDSSTQDLRPMEDIPEAVRKSLEILDSIIDEVEQESQMPRRNRSNVNGTLDRRNRHEDIRHSLEVLDNVLAEFDDCLESLDGSSSLDFKRSSDPSSELHRNFQSDDISPNGSKCYDNVSLDDKLFCFNNSRGGSTSHNSSNAVQEQPKVGSPPPIPKRSPNTRLSEQMLSPFTFPSDDTSLDSYDSNRSDSAVHCDGLSDHAQISSLSQLQKNSDTTLGECRSIAKNIYDADKCANCGRELKRTARAMESSEDAKVSSPFQQRKEMFEAKIAEGLSNTPIPKGVNRSYGSSFRVRKTTPEHVDTSSEPVSLPADLSKSIDSASQLSKESLSYVTVSGDERDQSVSFSHHSINCSCKAKIQKLDAKFSETKRLLKLNSINGLDSKPPSFVPPPPPVINGVGGKSDRTSVLQLVTEEASRNKILRMDGNSSGLLRVKDSLQDSEVDSFYSVDNTKESFQSANSGLEKCLDLNKADSPKLCNRCSSCLSTCLSTIEDLPNLLPTDALNRPHLGLSYSMEDDFFVETKEIQQTSTPKSDASSLSLFKTKESSLSTFSHSASSLGYVSSQSDLELNNLPPVPDKVPVSTFKSRTLPNGLDLSPFYSPIDTEQSPHSGEGKDHNGNRCVKTVHVSHEDLLQLRSSSAPLPPEAEKPKKKYFRFSRKDKKDKKKNDDSLSLKSDLSFDEGIILKKIGTLDGSIVLTDDSTEKVEVGGEKKRRSMWRNFIGKK